MLQFDHFSFEGKKVLIRVDFNVPLDENKNITDDTRIRGAEPTIQKILDDGGSVVLMSHLGRPKDGPTDKYSLKHLLPRLAETFGRDHVSFVDDCISDEAFALSSAIQPGQVLLLENLRFYKEEEKGDQAFAEKLSRHGEVYINDAFGTAHRAHASTAVIADFFSSENKGFGYLMNAEIENAEFVLHKSKKPVTAIVGGAKVSDKIQLLERLVDIMDNILIGGGMAYTFIAAQGGKIGNSLFEPDFTALALKILAKAEEKNTKIYLPVDSVSADRFAADAEKQTTKSDSIPDGWMGLDIGPEAVETYKNVVLDSKTILWNGPMGVFEFINFSNGTFSIAEAVANATDKGAFSLIGGGDSVSAIQQSGLSERVSYISTGGGAMLEFLEGKELPGISAIRG
ncbi:MAG: phosphoglycerate kinase [Saprospiraceae bacterium]|nr:phosphoglycerate kinase [Saprospiraceae bacterium]